MNDLAKQVEDLDGEITTIVSARSGAGRDRLALTAHATAETLRPLVADDATLSARLRSATSRLVVGVFAGTLPRKD